MSSHPTLGQVSQSRPTMHLRPRRTFALAALVALIAACSASADEATAEDDQAVAEAVELNAAALPEGWRALSSPGALQVAGQNCEGIAPLLTASADDTARAARAYGPADFELPFVRTTVLLRPSVEGAQRSFDPLEGSLGDPASCLTSHFLDFAHSDPDLAQFDIGVSVSPGPALGLGDQAQTIRTEISAEGFEELVAIFDFAFVRVGRAILTLEVGRFSDNEPGLDPAAILGPMADELARTPTIDAGRAS